MKFTVTHSGKQHAYQHAHSLERLGMLDRLVTSTYYRRDRWPDRLARMVPRLDRFLKKRSHPDLSSDLVIRRPDFEFPELWYRNVRKQPSRAENATFHRDAKFDRWVADRHIGRSDAIWGFQGSCLETMTAARAKGQLAVCEFATAHVTAAIRILTDEANRHPEWKDTISNLHFPDWYQQRLEQEPLAADICIAASGFTRDSLLEVGVHDEKIKLLPLGVDVDQFRFEPRSPDGPLKVLFVGGIGQRKGIKYLFQAMEQINSPHVQLQLLGPMPPDRRPLERWKPHFEYLGQTDQKGVVDHMHRADVLVLPSVFEGFGLVIVEAMATGMPVIASTHSCGPEVIVSGEHGFVLRPDDIRGLAEKIEWCASHRAQLLEMGESASRQAVEFSWRMHSHRLGSLIRHLPNA